MCATNYLSAIQANLLFLKCAQYSKSFLCNSSVLRQHPSGRFLKDVNCRQEAEVERNKLPFKGYQYSHGKWHLYKTALRWFGISHGKWHLCKTALRWHCDGKLTSLKGRVDDLGCFLPIKNEFAYSLLPFFLFLSLSLINRTYAIAHRTVIAITSFDKRYYDNPIIRKHLIDYLYCYLDLYEEQEFN